MQQVENYSCGLFWSLRESSYKLDEANFFSNNYLDNDNTPGLAGLLTSDIPESQYQNTVYTVRVCKGWTEENKSIVTTTKPIQSKCRVWRHTWSVAGQRSMSKLTLGISRLVTQVASSMSLPLIHCIIINNAVCSVTLPGARGSRVLFSRSRDNMNMNKMIRWE